LRSPSPEIRDSGRHYGSGICIWNDIRALAAAARRWLVIGQAEVRNRRARFAVLLAGLAYDPLVKKQRSYAVFESARASFLFAAPLKLNGQDAVLGIAVTFDTFTPRKVDGPENFTPTRCFERIARPPCLSSSSIRV